jgi:hypothetical protein
MGLARLTPERGREDAVLDLCINQIYKIIPFLYDQMRLFGM